MGKQSGVNKTYRIDLATARTGEKKSVLGKYVRIADASSANAAVSIAVQENFEERYENLKKNGKIFEGSGFNAIYIKNDAQPGEWVRVIVSDGPDDYDVDNPSQSIIDSIANTVDVEVQNTVTVDGEVAVTKSTVLNTAADASVGATTAASVLGANAARRQAIISNLAANGTVVRVGDASTGASRGAEIPVGGSATIESTEAIYVYNPSGGSISIGLCWNED